MDPKRGFRLNGKPCRLLGFGLHQDGERADWAMSDADIAGSDRRDIAATYRRGEFSYRLPVQVERYRVILTFVEQDRAEKFGVFAVRLNGQTGLNQYGVRAEARGPLPKASPPPRTTP